MRILSITLALIFAVGLASAQNEIVSMSEKAFDYKDWVYKNVDSGKDVNLRKFVNGKKLVIVVYWAPWCHNWEYDVAYVQSLYEKYKGNGLDIIGVAEYDPVDKMKEHIKKHNVTFTNVYESTSTVDREKTTHFTQRREAGDTRKWGSPWYLFLDGSKLEPEGQSVLSKKTLVVNGELKRDEVEKYIQQRLGLQGSATGTVSAKSKEIEVCEPNKSAGLLKP
jgi:thiol-disulfide isomerase/thioredoxin